MACMLMGNHLTWNKNIQQPSFMPQDYMILTERGARNSSGIWILEKKTGNEVSSGIMHPNHDYVFDVIAFAKQNQPTAGELMPAQSKIS